MTTVARPVITRCRDCALRRRRLFRPLISPEVAFLEEVKTGEVHLEAGTELIVEGAAAAAVYTLLDGWAIRFLAGAGERRQILEILLPGDTIGVTAAVTGRSGYSVATLTDARFCMLHLDSLARILRDLPCLALDLLRTQLHDAERTDMRFAAWGQLDGHHRVGFFVIEIYERLCQRGMTDGTSCMFPLRGIDVADAVGLSRVHVARALRELRDRDLAHLRRGRLTLPDPERLALHVGHDFDPAPMQRTIL